MATMLPILSCLVHAVAAAPGDTIDRSRCDHDGDLLSLLQTLGSTPSAASAMSTPLQDAHLKAHMQQPLRVVTMGAERHFAMVATVATHVSGRRRQAMVQQTQKSNVFPVHAVVQSDTGTWLVPLLAIGLCIVIVLMCVVVVRHNCPNPSTPLTMQRGVSPSDFFSKRGVDLPSHLSTESGCWKSLLLVATLSALVIGPITSWPTLEPILINEGVFAGPDQELKLTVVYSLATGIALIGTIFAGVSYDAVGPRATSAWSAFGVAACLVGMTFGVQFRSLNFLLWICYPAAIGLGAFATMGGYAWLYLLPDHQNSVSALMMVMPYLAASFALVAVFLHNKINLSLPVYFATCSFLSLMAGIVSLMLVPEHSICQEIAFVVTSLDLDVQSKSDDSTDSSVKREVESFWDVVKRSSGAIRDSCICLFYYCPGASCLYIFGFCFSTYMFAMYPTFIMYPFYQALLGTATATTLVSVYSGLQAFVGAGVSLLFGLFVDYVGFEASIASMSVPIMLNFAFFCVPSFAAQVIGQMCNAGVQCAVSVLIPRWCLSYAPFELYGTTFGFLLGILGLFQMIAAPLAWIASKLIDSLATSKPAPVMPFLTGIGVWCSLAVISSFAYLLFMRYYPMPASGGTTMAEIVSYTKGAKEDLRM